MRHFHKLKRNYLSTKLYAGAIQQLPTINNNDRRERVKLISRRNMTSPSGIMSQRKTSQSPLNFLTHEVSEFQNVSI